VWQAVGVVIRRAAMAMTVVLLALAGCGGQPRSAAPSTVSVTSAFKGSPPPLASLHAQANELLAGGQAAFDARLQRLRGYPVVVNKWASWCGPCQTEFPAYQRAAVRFGRRVAFIGVDAKDANTAAATFLRQFPVTYPSYVDPNEQISNAIQAATFFPQTIFFDRQGKSVYDHAGPYLTAAALERDVRRYALG
jgi:thiol-disulfide isomerase/thioredoxin